MPRYIIERNVGALTPEEVEAGGRKSKEAAESIPGLVWIRSYYSDTEGKVYCEYEARAVEAIREHARRAGLPIDRISEVSMEISPDMFV